jgi:hypothetical protein
MRRSLVLTPSLVLALAAVVLLGVAAAHATPRRAHNPMIVCPLPAASAVTPPCCGPPIESPDVQPICCEPPTPSPDIQPICCGTVGPCSVSISASPNPANGAQQVTVSGAVAGGTPAGTTVQLFQEAAGEANFSQVGSATTGAAGDYSITAPGAVQTDRQWYVTAATLRSATISEQVSAGVTLLVARGRNSAMVHGVVTPSHAGERVMLQRQERGKWTTIARLRLGSKSKFGVRYAGKPRVRATLRAVLPADSKNMRSVSASVTGVVFPLHSAR